MCVGYTLFRIRDLSICGSLVSLGKSGNQSPWVLRDDGKHINVVGNQMLLWNGETQRLRERRTRLRWIRKCIGCVHWEGPEVVTPSSSEHTQAHDLVSKCPSPVGGGRV